MRLRYDAAVGSEVAAVGWRQGWGVPCLCNSICLDGLGRAATGQQLGHGRPDSRPTEAAVWHLADLYSHSQISFGSQRSHVAAGGLRARATRERFVVSPAGNRQTPTESLAAARPRFCRHRDEVGSRHSQLRPIRPSPQLLCTSLCSLLCVAAALDRNSGSTDSGRLMPPTRGLVRGPVREPSD